MSAVKIMARNLQARLLAELLGSLFLVVAAISPMILMYDILGSSLAIAVLADAIAVGIVLFVLMEVFGPVSGCHINPVVTMAKMMQGEMDRRTGGLYIVNQVLGGILGMFATHMMFIHDIPVLMTVSEVSRPAGTYFAEFLGTFMLVLTIIGCERTRSRHLGLAVGLVVGGFVLVTSSTMFANPQVTVARIFTYAIAGVSPLDAMYFILAQVIGGVLAVKVSSYLFIDRRSRPNRKRRKR